MMDGDGEVSDEYVAPDGADVRYEITRPLHLQPDSNFIGSSIADVLPLLPVFQGCVICEKCDKDGDDSKRKRHLQTFHCALAVSRKLKDGKKVFCFPCRKGCMKRTGKNIKRSHYHCPVCKNMCGRRANMIHHMKICQGGGRIFNRERVRSSESPQIKFQVNDEENESGSDHVVTIMEKRLTSWIQSQRQAGKSVNIETLQAKAKFYYDKTKNDFGIRKGKFFYPSRQWTKDFMKRNGMKDMTIVDLEESSVATAPSSSGDIMLEIISHVQRNPCLYDPLLAAIEEQNSERETQLWEEIAKSVGFDSGETAKAIWKRLEERYITRNKSGAPPGVYWEYEKYLNFLSNALLQSFSSDGHTVYLEQATEAIEDVEPDGENIMTVTISGSDNMMDSVDTGEETMEERGELSSINKRIKAAELRKINLEIENMKEEHTARMEILNMEKEILMKKLDRP